MVKEEDDNPPVRFFNVFEIEDLTLSFVYSNFGDRHHTNVTGPQGRTPGASHPASTDADHPLLEVPRLGGPEASLDRCHPT